MTPREARKVAVESTEFYKRMRAIISAVVEERSMASVRLKHLLKELPLLQAGEALGEHPASAVQSVRQEIAQLERFIEEATLTIRGLIQRERAVIRNHAKALGVLRQQADEVDRPPDPEGKSRQLAGEQEAACPA